jgi:hypothetical protein
MPEPSPWPTPPCLDVSLFRRSTLEHPAIGLHRGWCAARNQEPWDPTEADSWQEGYLLRLRVEWYGAVTARPIPRPTSAR